MCFDTIADSLSLSASKTNLVQYHKSEFTTDRRYNDFVWLFDKMKESFKGYIIPPLPDKTIIQSTFLILRHLHRLLLLRSFAHSSFFVSSLAVRWWW